MSESSVLAGRTALVTGASRGIGRAVAMDLAAAGASVWCLARSQAALDDLASEIDGTALVADLADDVAVWDAVDRLTDSVGGAPDIVVNAAGLFAVGPAHETTVETFDRQIGINLRGTFLVCRAVLPGMLERGSGLLVNVGSVAGRRAFSGNSVYSASKFGVRGYHEVLLEELRGSGVRATLIEPAATNTEIWDPFRPDEDPNLPDRSQMLAAEDVAAAVRFVATRPDEVRVPLLQIERA